MLAKNLQAPHSFSKHALSLTFFASKLAPTEGDDHLTDWHYSYMGQAMFLTDSRGVRIVQGEWVMSAILSTANAPVSEVSNTT